VCVCVCVVTNLFLIVSLKDKNLLLCLPKDIFVGGR